MELKFGLSVSIGDISFSIEHPELISVQSDGRFNAFLVADDHDDFIETFEGVLKIGIGFEHRCASVFELMKLRHFVLQSPSSFTLMFEHREDEILFAPDGQNYRVTDTTATGERRSFVLERELFSRSVSVGAQIALKALGL